MPPSANRKAVVMPVGDDAGELCQALEKGLSDRNIEVVRGISAVDLAGAQVIALVSRTPTRKFLSAVSTCSSGRRTIAILGNHDVDGHHVAEIIQNGAHDVLRGDHSEILAELVARLDRWFEVDTLIESERVLERAVGRSHVWVDLVRRLVEVAHFTDYTVLLHGPSGTGKDLLARLIHELEPRPKRGGFVILDCTTVVPELAGSEFFGHERGAFTGAITGREGVFAEADQGTLFLDEIGDLPLTLQAQLLRVIQEGTYRRVGSNLWYRTRFRLVCATNKNLLEEVEAGRFRRDLYYRIAQWTFDVPPLNERVEDIPLLIRHFLKSIYGEAKLPVCDSVVEDFLRTRAYPGNVRELRTLVERLCLLKDRARVLTPGCIPAEEWQQNREQSQQPPANGSSAFIRSALNQSFGLDEIAALARREAIRTVLTDELEQAGSDKLKRSEILARAAQRLKCSLRWIQICSKDHALFPDSSGPDKL